MATLRQRKGKWQVQIRREGSPALSRTFQQRRDAQRWARQTEARIDRQGLGSDPRQLTRLTLGDLLKRFKETECPLRRGGRNETIVIGAILRRDIASLPLSALTRDQFAGYRDLRLQTVKAGTLLRELGLVQAILERARHDWGIPLPENPLKGLRKPRADKGRDRRLSSSELDSLNKALSKSRNRSLGPLIELALETAMRRGELLNIRAGDIDWSAKTLRIPKTKTDEPRTIPLTPKAFELLAVLTQNKKTTDHAFGLTPEAVKQGWMRLTKRAGIDDLNFHDLRHEAISRLFEHGLTIPEVGLISGHKDPRMLFRYTHLRPEDVARKLARLPEDRTRLPIGDQAQVLA